MILYGEGNDIRYVFSVEELRINRVESLLVNRKHRPVLMPIVIGAIVFQNCRDLSISPRILFQIKQLVDRSKMVHNNPNSRRNRGK